jgi:SOS-response transcriptional repressor LexA
MGAIVKQRFSASQVLLCDERHHEDSAMLKTKGTAERERLAATLATAMAKAGVSNAQLARACGVSVQAITGWLRDGRIAKRHLPTISALLDCPLSMLLGEARPSGLTLNQEIAHQRADKFIKTARSMPLLRKVPVIPWARAEWWERAVAVSQEQVWTTVAVGSRAFALVVAGDAMAGAIPDGAAIIVDPDGKPEHRSIVLAQRPGEAPLLRRLWFDGGVPQLRAENPSYPLLSFPDGTHIIGVAVSYTVTLR